MTVRSENHEALCFGPYLIALDTEECIVGTRLWFDARCGMIEVEETEVDCMVLKEAKC